MAIAKLIDLRPGAENPDDLYMNPEFPDPNPDRPYVFINMVSTADGKTLIGPRGSSARGVGGPTDQLLMRRLEEAADCVIIGSSTLRASHVVYPPGKWRAVVTRTGDLPLDNRFFTDSPDRCVVFAPDSLETVRADEIRSRVQLRIVGADSVPIREAVSILRREFGIGKLLMEGGARLNFDFFTACVVDELFLTVAAKVKGGEDLPTVVDGPGLPGREFVALKLISVYHDSDELYLRYKIVGS